MLSAFSGSVLFSIFSMLALMPDHVILTNLTGSMIVHRLQPALLFLTAVIFLRQKPHWRDYIALLTLLGASYLGLFGMAPITTSPDGFNTASLAYSGLAICFGAIGTITSKLVSSKLNAVLLSSTRIVTAAVSMLLLTAIVEFQDLSFERIGPSLLIDWWRYLIIAVVYFFGLILYYRGVKGSTVASIAIAEAAVLVVTPLLIFGVVSSTSSLWTFVAIAMALSAIALTVRVQP
jgi:drug/metabolite transporter (DMT)-like permease